MCVSKPDKNGVYCSKNGEAAFFKEYKDTENDISMPLNDAQRYYNQCFDPRSGD